MIPRNLRPVMNLMVAEEWRGLKIAADGLDELLGKIGCRLFPFERSITHLVKWSLETDLLEVLKPDKSLHPSDISKLTRLNERGAEALLGVMCALDIVAYDSGLGYSLTSLGRDYMFKDSAYYIGNELYAPARAIPKIFLRKSLSIIDRFELKIRGRLSKMRFGEMPRLLNQQVRNLASNFAAVHSEQFSSSKSLLDLAGGSGVFSIPLAYKYPEMKITLAEIKGAIDNVKKVCSSAGVRDRIEIVDIQAFETPWTLGSFDTIFVGNFLHGFDDDACILVCSECFKHLVPGGKICIHEMLWNENKRGPMIAALWNVSMCLYGGKQRSYEEVRDLLIRCGFNHVTREKTANAMELVTGYKL